MFRVLGAFALFTWTASIQAQAQPAAPPRAGLETDWDIGAVLQQIAAYSDRLLPALQKLNARTWVDKGASETYVAQWQSSKEQAKALADGARALVRNPEKLSATLEVLFRIHGL